MPTHHKAQQVGDVLDGGAFGKWDRSPGGDRNPAAELHRPPLCPLAPGQFLDPGAVTRKLDRDPQRHVPHPTTVSTPDAARPPSATQSLILQMIKVNCWYPRQYPRVRRCSST